ncbi:MAG: CopG family antitoxin [Thermodesulfobacteriota bacterium]|nr:CopG family antitoxin [Thermodesulfobacteriota bacterium]
MGKNRIETSISKAGTLEEIGEFWDNHSLGDYWDKTREVEFNVRAKKRHRIIIEPELFDKIVNRSHMKGILPETLINLWLSEKVQESEIIV